MPQPRRRKPREPIRRPPALVLLDRGAAARASLPPGPRERHGQEGGRHARIPPGADARRRLAEEYLAQARSSAGPCAARMIRRDARYDLSRTALAEWLTDVDHGAGALLARVIVNRLWQHHFGEGLVRTPDDFGAPGDRPAIPSCSSGWPASSSAAAGDSSRFIGRSS